MSEPSDNRDRDLPLGAAALPPAAPGVDPRSALAMGLQAAPGAYAMLLGSGMSRAAGIPTAWEVVQDLIRRVATADGVDPGLLGGEPESWWEAQGHGQPKYDTLLAALAPADAARQRLLAEYFDPPAIAGETAEPTVAHHELALLVARGRVRLILTTNLDRLIERALDRVGLVPQVISAPEQVQAMTPLTHARATVVKLHGDYTMLGTRHTTAELADYPSEWKRILTRTFEEYGLVIVGWSAEYDKALVDSFTNAPRNPYPVFWTLFDGAVTEAARRLIGQRRASVVEIGGADEFLLDLNRRIARLDQIARRKRKAERLRAFTPKWSGAYSPPDGWAAHPLLHLRTVAIASPVGVEDVDDLGPEQRDVLRTALNRAPFTLRLRELMTGDMLDAASGEHAPSVSLDQWEPPPRARQSSGHATYRLGGNAESGVSALATIWLPSTGAGAAQLIVDCGLSLAQRLFLFQLGRLLRDSLLATGAMFDAIADILPSQADVNRAEIYISAQVADGRGGKRENALGSRVDLAPLGTADRDLPEIVQYAARIGGPLVEHDAAELVVEAIRGIALDWGYLDPRPGLAELRAQMGLTDRA